MRTIKLTLAYDGTAYAGWQFQPDRMSVQQTLESALERVTGERIRVLASGRTDAGVHALGQVVGFQTASTLPPEVLRRAINANLPEDVAVLEVAEVPEGFHPTGSVRRKRYRYVIHDGPVRNVFARRYAWHYIHGRLDAAAMQRAAAALLGTHDFRSFKSAGAERATSVRTIFDIRVERGRAGKGGNQDWGLGIGDWRLAIVATPRDCGRGGSAVSLTRSVRSTLPSRSRPTGSSTTWSGRSWARWSRWAAGPGRKAGPAKSSAPRTAAPPARRRPRKDCSWCAWNTEPRRGDFHASFNQLTTLSPSTREKWASLLVTSVPPRAKAWAAISRSIAPMLRPATSSSWRIRP